MKKLRMAIVIDLSEYNNNELKAEKVEEFAEVVKKKFNGNWLIRGETPTTLMNVKVVDVAYCRRCLDETTETNREKKEAKETSCKDKVQQEVNADVQNQSNMFDAKQENKNSETA